MPAEPQPTVKHIGDFEIVALSDGLLPASNASAILDPSEAAKISGVPEGGVVNIPVNAFLIRFRGRTALVDTGSSDTQGPTLGFLASRLTAIGVAPTTIDYVFVTHVHPDHTNGLITPSGEIAYPNAQIIVHEREAAFWLDREPSGADTERVARGKNAARRTLLPYGERVIRARDGEFLTGISAVPSHGHTPGHTGWLVHSGREALIFWGDTVHMAALQVPRPDVVMIYDIDKEAARKSRIDMFERVITENVAVAGAHLDYPGFVRVVRRGAGYAMESDG